MRIIAEYLSLPIMWKTKVNLDMYDASRCQKRWKLPGSGQVYLG